MLLKMRMLFLKQDLICPLNGMIIRSDGWAMTKLQSRQLSNNQVVLGKTG
jgi:hypothetical protein